MVNERLWGQAGSQPAWSVAFKLLVAAVTTSGLIGIPAYIVGWKWESEKHFLKSYHTPDWAEAHIKNQMDYVMSSRDANDVIFIGDSTTSVGIRPVLFERQTGLRAYNLALPGHAGIDSSLRLVESYLKYHPEPRLIVYSAHPKDFGTVTPNWGQMRPRFARSYGVWSGGEPFKPDLSPTYFVREGIRIVAGELRGGQNHYLGPSVTEWRNLTSKQRGFYESPGTVGEDAKMQQGDASGYVVSSWYKAHLTGLAHIASKHRIPLLIQPSPVMARNSPQDAAQLLTWLREFQRANPDVLVSASPLLLYDVANFSDPMHMNPSGATRFTTDLADLAMIVYPHLRSSSNSRTIQ